MPRATATKQTDTKQRLMESAGEVFAEHGFREATVREICQRAQANIASVSYYFGSKERLYAATLRFWAAEAVKRHPPDLGLGDHPTVEEELRAFVRGLLYRFLDEERAGLYGRLMTREIVEPTPALDEIVREVIRPMADRLHEIIRNLLGQAADEAQVHLCVMSVVGQCLLYKNEREILSRLYGTQLYTTEDLERIAAHITTFSIQAIAHLTPNTRSPHA